jgi:hypothetical protein
VGLITLLAGALFCFRGGAALRALMALWGGFVGFAIGAEVVSVATGRPPFAGPAGWLGALVGALVLASLVYVFYALAVIVTVGSIGFGLGAGLATAVGAGEAWVGAAGLGGALLLAVIALTSELPRLLLVMLGALVGAAAMVGALMLLLGDLDLAHLTSQGIRNAVAASPWWTGVWVVLAALGTFVQLRRPPAADAGWSRRRTT